MSEFERDHRSQPTARDRFCIMGVFRLQLPVSDLIHASFDFSSVVIAEVEQTLDHLFQGGLKAKYTEVSQDIRVFIVLGHSTSGLIPANRQLHRNPSAVRSRNENFSHSPHAIRPTQPPNGSDRCKQEFERHRTDHRHRPVRPNANALLSTKSPASGRCRRSCKRQSLASNTENKIHRPYLENDGGQRRRLTAKSRLNRSTVFDFIKLNTSCRNLFALSMVPPLLSTQLTTSSSKQAQL